MLQSPIFSGPFGPSVPRPPEILEAAEFLQQHAQELENSAMAAGSDRPVVFWRSVFLMVFWRLKSWICDGYLMVIGDLNLGYLMVI